MTAYFFRSRETFDERRYYCIFWDCLATVPLSVSNMRLFGNSSIKSKLTRTYEYGDKSK